MTSMLDQEAYVAQRLDRVVLKERIEAKQEKRHIVLDARHGTDKAQHLIVSSSYKKMNDRR